MSGISGTDDRLTTCREKYMKFSLEGGKCVILDADQAQRDSPIILNLHAITFDRSAELRCEVQQACVWNPICQPCVCFP